MHSPPDHTSKSWALLADGHFQEFDELAQSIDGWDVDFRQLGPGRSPADLMQFGSPDFLVSRFHISKPCDQRGSTPPGMLTLGFRDKGSGKIVTPEGGQLPMTEYGVFPLGANSRVPLNRISVPVDYRFRNHSSMKWRMSVIYGMCVRP